MRLKSVRQANAIPFRFEIFDIACDQYGLMNLRSRPNDGIRQVDMMNTAQLNGSFCNRLIKRGDFKMRFQKIAQPGIIPFLANQYFHPGNSADQDPFIARIFGVGLLYAIERVNQDVRVENSDHCPSHSERKLRW
jgi:hypothetical protein